MGGRELDCGLQTAIFVWKTSPTPCVTLLPNVQRLFRWLGVYGF